MPDPYSESSNIHTPSTDVSLLVLRRAHDPFAGSHSVHRDAFRPCDFPMTPISPFSDKTCLSSFHILLSPRKESADGAPDCQQHCQEYDTYDPGFILPPEIASSYFPTTGAV
jgi:hypothetical protein